MITSIKLTYKPLLKYTTQNKDITILHFFSDMSVGKLLDFPLSSLKVHLFNIYLFFKSEQHR